jgi:hypothetical protein
MSKRERDDAPVGTITVTATITRSDKPSGFEYTYDELDDRNASLLVDAWTETYDSFEEFMEVRTCANKLPRPSLDECARGAVTTYTSAVAVCARDDVLDVLERAVRCSSERTGRVHVATLYFIGDESDRIAVDYVGNEMRPMEIPYNIPFASLGNWTDALQLATRSERIEAEDEFAAKRRVNIYYSFE